MDTEKTLYKALGNGKLRRGSLMWFLNPWSIIWQHAKWAKEECGITKSNLKVCPRMLTTLAPAGREPCPVDGAQPLSKPD